MGWAALNGGAYSAESVIANAQRCANLYPEANPAETSPATPVTHYLTPGISALCAPGGNGVRGLYRSTAGILYSVIAANVYRINADFTSTLLGNIANHPTPVSMKDNGSIVVLVDGTAAGYWWDMATDTFHTIADAAFFGSRRVCFLDGFFVFSVPGLSNQFYISPYFWNGTDPFDPTQIAQKTGGPDPILNISVINGELWLIGSLTTEVWFDAGGQDFPFARQPGVFIEHGMVAAYSIAESDVQNMWLSRDIQGQAVVFKGAAYSAVRISNHAVENAIQGYAEVDDAIGFTYQENGHTFYFLIFPNADKTWVYDFATEQWHERVWTNPSDQTEHRHRANCYAFAYNTPIVGDWENSNVYRFALNILNDNGAPIVRRRGFPHILDSQSGARVSYSAFRVKLDVSQLGAGAVLSMRFSNDAGANFGSPLTLTATGNSKQALLWRRLGMGRDRVFEVFWSFGYKTALNGAWVETEKAET